MIVLPLVVLLAAAATPASSAATPASPAPAAAPARRVADRVAATVNGEVVTLSDLVDRAGPEYDRAEHLPAGPEREEARTKVLRAAFEQVVSERLLHDKAVELQIESNDQQIDAAIEDIKKRNNFDDAQLDEALRQQGLDRATFRQNVKREYDAFLVLQYQVRGRVKITDEDLKNYYQTHTQEFGGEPEAHVRHILLPLAENAPPAEEAKVRAEMEKIRQRLLSGEDFAKVAKQVSKGPSAQDGGDLGWLRHGTIDQRLEEAALALKPGEISKPVRAGPGLHLFKVEEKRLAGAKTFDQAKEEIRQKLFEQQAGSYRDQMLAELRKDAFIDAKIPELASAK
ncbi:MAG TPA: peptidylprolyl isomerase [Anaeromyxobacter sp.]|nr:peptidylprolyl isomerase [Anaeromyxobacter sp.]